MSKRMKIIIVYIVAVICVIAGIIGYRVWKQHRALKASKDSGESTLEEQYITYDGKKYRYNQNLRNILFLGVDKADILAEQETGQGGQSDTMILLSMDKEKKITTLLEIPRDTMTDIKIYDINGEYLATERKQITLQYAYGDGKKKSCRLSQAAVSDLLYGIPIHSYVALGIDGVPVITDLMGGVSLTVPEDYTYIDPVFVQGESVLLNGEQAERYIRYRDTNVTGSNEERLERQTDFLEALAAQLQGKDFSWYQNLLTEAGDYITTDLSLNEIEKLTEYEMSSAIETVPGETRAGEEHDEFIVDNRKLQEIVVKLFYKQLD